MGGATLLAVGFCLSVTFQAAQNEIDLFMEQVLERRDENWVQLHEYVLDEREVFQVVGPGGVPLQSVDREYSWFVLDGHLIRSPARINGVEVSEEERREFEADWLRQEQRRAENPERGRGIERRRSTRDTFDNIMITVEREWGRRVTDDLGRALADDAELWRDDGAAIVAGTDRIVIDLGGVERVGFGRVVSETRDAFVMLETDRLNPRQVARVLSVMIPMLSDVVDSASETEVEGFVELVQLLVQFRLNIPDIAPVLARTQAALADRGVVVSAEALAEARMAFAALPESPSASIDDDEAARNGVSIGVGMEPRFVSESYFLDFEFEPGNYYFAGRDVVAGREVLKIEYYPQQLFSDPADDSNQATDNREDRIDAGFDKTSLVTLWVDADEHQIVKFTFDNVGFDFLPMRWLVRLDDLTASMVMGQPFEGVWLPEAVEINGQLTLAAGTFTVEYSRQFSNYRQAEVRARIRSYGTPQR